MSFGKHVPVVKARNLRNYFSLSLSQGAGRMNGHRSERGQAIVLIVFALIAMMGFAALAVDVGHVYAERRRAQNAADAGAYAAAYKAVTGAKQADILKAGNDSIKLNGFTHNGTTTSVQVNHPPISGDYKDDDEYIQVFITQHVDMNFAQIVYGGKEAFIVEAVARAADPTSSSAGNVLHSTLSAGSGIEFKGNVDVFVKGGNIYSLSNVDQSGGSGVIDITGGRMLYSGSMGSMAGLTSTESPASQKVPQIIIPDLPMPKCPANKVTSAPAAKKKDAPPDLEPGTYTFMITSTANLTGGIYCLEKGIKLTGGDHLTGRDVLLVLLPGATEKDPDASLEATGNSYINLSRADSQEDANGSQWGGMLVYMPKGNTGEIDFGGTNDTYVSGTIYAPDAECDLGGNNDSVGYETNIICKTFKFHGNPKLVISYNAKQNYRMPPMISLIH